MGACSPSFSYAKFDIHDWHDIRYILLQTTQFVFENHQHTFMGSLQLCPYSTMTWQTSEWTLMKRARKRQGGIASESGAQGMWPASHHIVQCSNHRPQLTVREDIYPESGSYRSKTCLWLWTGLSARDLKSIHNHTVCWGQRPRTVVQLNGTHHPVGPLCLPHVHLVLSSFSHSLIGTISLL